MTAETLYDRLGGADGVEAVVDEFYDRVLADERLAPYFEGVDTDALRDHQRRFISHVAGGPIEYDGRGMAAAHDHLDVTDDDFDRVADHLDASLRAFDVAASDRTALLEAVAALKTDVVSAPVDD
jgi:hemoglobin